MQSTTAADQTGKGFIGMAKGFFSSAKSIVKGAWNAMTNPRQTGANLVNAVSNPVKVWKGLSLGASEWANNLRSKDPAESGFALGQAFEAGAEIYLPALPIAKGISTLASKIPYVSGKFVIRQKTVVSITAHLEQFGVKAENTIMLSRLQKIANKELKASDIDLNFAKHELREQQLQKGGMKYPEAHEAVLKEQGMWHRNYQEKLYTEEALKAGDAQIAKEVHDGIK